MPAIPAPLFPDDDGTADPRVLASLNGSDSELVESLRGKRLYVAVLAHLVSTDGDGHEKESEMALAIVERSEGSLLPVFTSLESLSTWRADARPVQVLAEAAGMQAITDEMNGLLIDGSRLLSGPALRAMVFNFPLMPLWQDPVVEGALQSAISLHEEIVTAWLDQANVGDHSEPVDAVVTLLIPTLYSEDAQRVAGAVASWLAEDPNIRLRTSRGFDVQVVTAR